MGFTLSLERGILLKSKIELILLEGIETSIVDRFPPAALPMAGKVNPLSDLSMEMLGFEEFDIFKRSRFIALSTIHRKGLSLGLLILAT